jgi:hypothetical protein
MAWDAGDLRDPGDHPVDVASVDGIARDRPQDEWSGAALAAAGFQDAEDGQVSGMVAGLVAFADQVQHSVASQSLGANRARPGSG